VLVSSDPIPVPYAGQLEEAWMPDVDRIAEAVRRLG
jgi:hypothetical protein